MLRTKQLTKSFSRQEKTFEAVDHVDFSLDKGEFCILTGPSGCGKSTFFHLVCGITRADSGEIFFNGEDITNYSEKQLTELRANQVSYILQGDSLLPNFTVLENICLPHKLCGRYEGLEEKAMELLREFGLDAMAYDYPSNLSGGERRRVAIARAFVHGPELVVADEPTSDLDEENTAMIMDYFQRQAAEGKTIIISTHDLSCIRPDMIHYVMKKGVITRA
ncbi:MAG: ABC transporter ATP-binding protein [Firmicutes bacterium]|nr:ABC transporter ATP-binding protein [Bacillota bacterium]MBR3706253.1 ABC transporter ATP-binding protein [Bacillota bacterium]MBR6585640.1 ABC transporter ATP-binding protein [Bacillota bacterium]